MTFNLVNMCTRVHYCYWHNVSTYPAGSIYIDDCRLGNNRIPIWLVVFGCVSLAQTFINICKQCIQQVTKKSNREDGESSSNSVSRGGGCIESFLTGFLFVWIIVGSVWVFGIYDDYLAVGSQCNQCCHPVPYLFSFVVLLVIYTIGALFCCCLCGCFCCLLCLGAASDDSWILLMLLNFWNIVLFVQYGWFYYNTCMNVSFMCTTYSTSSSIGNNDYSYDTVHVLYIICRAIQQ